MSKGKGGEGGRAREWGREKQQRMRMIMPCTLRKHQEFFERGEHVLIGVGEEGRGRERQREVEREREKVREEERERDGELMRKFT